MDDVVKEEQEEVEPSVPVKSEAKLQYKSWRYVTLSGGNTRCRLNQF